MTVSCLFGKYVVSIEAQDNLSAFLSESLKKFVIIDSVHADATVKLYHYCNNTPFLNNGWNYINHNESSNVVYVNREKELFRLKYHNDLSIISAGVCDFNGKNLSLALQHSIMLSLYRNCIGFHGVTIICGDQAVILSAPSGTGKTTLAKLMQKHCDAAIINGDFSLLSSDKEYGIIFEPTPFCGTSNINHNYRLPISRIVFLEQAKEPAIRELTSQEAMVHILSNAFIPEWDNAIRQSLEALAMDIVEKIKICKFSLPPTQEAALMLQEYINK